MKYIPVLYNTPMVQSLLVEKKTMTRRTNGLDRVNRNPDSHKFIELTHINGIYEAVFENKISCVFQYEIKCPFGNIGDILWTRETFIKIHIDEEFEGRRFEFAYKASSDEYELKYGKIKNPIGKRFIDSWKWKPSIHMPKEACRLFHKITNIRVERLQDISEEDAIAEGVEPNSDELTNEQRLANYNNPSNAQYPLVHVVGFKSLWQSINGSDSWNKNPWVWVIEFKKTEKPINFI